MTRVSTRRRQALRGLAFASPFIVGFLVFSAYPIGVSLYYSFTDFNLFQSPNWVGGANFARLFADEMYWKAFFNTIYLTIVGVPLTIGIGILGAHLLNLPVRGQPLYRAFAYIPVIIPAVVGGYLWRWLLNAQYGFVNHFLSLLGIPGPGWLTEPEWTKPAIVLMSLWTVGGTMIIYLAALKDVPSELYEAAELDGAGVWRKFRHITWPTISPVTLFQVIVSVIAYLQIFAQPYLLSQTRLNSGIAGPGNSMLTLAMYLFQNAFTTLKMGYASAQAWVLLLLTLTVTAAILLAFRKWGHSGQD